MNENDQKRVFSENLRFYVERSGHQQKEIANILGVGPSTFNAWMKGKAIPNVSKIQTIADYFGVGKTALLDAHDNEQESADREASILYKRLDVDDRAETREFMQFKLSREKYSKKKTEKSHKG